MYLLLFIDRKWVFFNDFCVFFGVALEAKAETGHYRLSIGWLGWSVDCWKISAKARIFLAQRWFASINKDRVMVCVARVILCPWVV
ncbi:MAG TPA: hypothetical protein EYG11_12140 [Candidatus Latescibacteria bacterium]|nr:hypothetical protein [Candidatus Latescibacterota bacterium]